jgi:hypothetical protein
MNDEFRRVWKKIATVFKEIIWGNEENCETPKIE